MYNVAIIGAGQLGSRHLQGLKKSGSPLSITVVDNSVDSLKTACERYEEVSAVGEKKVEFSQDINQLPLELDLVIVASGSKPRAAIVKSLLNHSKVRNMVLEKVLFPKLSDYDEIGDLIAEKNVRTWVNCPRRMFGNYQQISHLIDVNKPIKMLYAAENWGICCNGIHIIDIFMSLTGEKDYCIDTSKLNNQLEESKRKGYIEMTGRLTLTTPKGNVLTLISEDNYKGEKGEYIDNQDLRIIVNEVNGTWITGGKENSYKMPFQSQLTGLLADCILISGCCPLTTYNLSARYHKPFIKALLAVYNRVINDNVDLLPIT